MPLELSLFISFIFLEIIFWRFVMPQEPKREKVVVVGAGPVGALAALYAAQGGNDVEVYELRNGTFSLLIEAV